MNKQHKVPLKHAAVIKAWADGAEIEWESPCGVWEIVRQPAWMEHYEYRVKPVAHKWQKEMDAFAAGKEIQYCKPNATPWYTTKNPIWCTLPSSEYRIKPELVERWSTVHEKVGEFSASQSMKFSNSNVKFTFEDGKLIKAEVL